MFVQNMAYRQPDDFGWDIIAGFCKLAGPAGCQADVIPLSLELQSSMGYDAFFRALRKNHLPARREIGKSAFYALSSQMGQTPIGTLLLHAELVERGSSGPAPV